MRRYQRHLGHELDQAALYRSLAASAEGELRQVLLELAAAEERHARFWQDKLGLDEEVSTAAGGRVRGRGRLLAFLAPRVGTKRLVPLLERMEAGEVTRYDNEAAAGPLLPVDERVHAQVVANLSPTWRTTASGSLRAAVFGMNDGLVSNLALLMGLAGGSAIRSVILLAGLAGLVAGAGSMAAGEYISVTSQRELLLGEVPLTAEALAGVPGADVRELGLLDRVRDGGARSVEDQLASIGSPIGAAAASFAAFGAGATVPLAPYLLGSGVAAAAVACTLAGAALFVVGALISLLTARPLVRSGVRQLAVGAVTALATYAVGSAVGVVID